MAAALRLVASQRLLRRLCPYCKVPRSRTGDLAIISDFPELKKNYWVKKLIKNQAVVNVI